MNSGFGLNLIVFINRIIELQFFIKTFQHSGGDIVLLFADELFFLFSYLDCLKYITSREYKDKIGYFQARYPFLNFKFTTVINLSLTINPFRPKLFPLRYQLF